MNPDTDPPAVAIDLVSKMGVLERDTCVDLLRSTPIGRIGFDTEDGPLVLPVNFAWHDDTIVFRTVEGQKLAAVGHGATVCFEVDRWDPSDRTGWSVVIRGRAEEVTDWAEKEQLENIGLVPWARAQWRPLWIKVSADTVDGRVLR